MFTRAVYIFWTLSKGIGQEARVDRSEFKLSRRGNLLLRMNSISLPPSKLEEYQCVITHDNNVMYTYKNLTRVVNILLSFSNTFPRSVDEAFRVYLKTYGSANNVIEVFLKNFEAVLNMYLCSKFPNIQNLLIADTQTLINENFPINIWVDEDAVIFCIYDSERLTRLVHKSLSLLYLVNISSASGDSMFIKNDNNFNLCSKYKIERERVLNKIQSAYESPLYIPRSAPLVLGKIKVGDSLFNPEISRSTVNEGIHREINSVWTSENTTALDVLFFIVAILERGVSDVLETYSQTVRPLPEITVGFPRVKKEKFHFINTTLGSFENPDPVNASPSSSSSSALLLSSSSASSSSFTNESSSYLQRQSSAHSTCNLRGSSSLKKEVE